MSYRTVRKAFHELVEPSGRGLSLGRVFDIALMVLIGLNVFAVIMETVPEYRFRYNVLFWNFEVFSIAVFTVEYAVRLWISVDTPRFAGARFPRLRYVMSPMAIVDIIAIVPFYLSVFFVVDLRFLRMLRLLRIFKLTRYSAAMGMLLDVFRQEANSFFAGFFILMVLLVIAAGGAYLAEHQVQPQHFGSIPKSMWWAIVTLTTVGYGDVIPVTLAGRLFGACITVVGIGMAALPAGILASGLAEQINRRRQELRTLYRQALEDGIVDPTEIRDLENTRKELGVSKALAAEILKDVERERHLHRLTHRCPHCGGELHIAAHGAPVP